MCVIYVLEIYVLNYLQTHKCVFILVHHYQVALLYLFLLLFNFLRMTCIPIKRTVFQLLAGNPVLFVSSCAQWWLQFDAPFTNCNPFNPPEFSFYLKIPILCTCKQTVLFIYLLSFHPFAS